MIGLRWVRLEAGFPANAKVVGLVGAHRHRALVAYVCSLAWSGQQGTDGHVPRAALPMVHARPIDARHLVEAGLWETNGDGWTIHDWGHYQPTVEQAELLADTRRTKAQRAANVRWGNAL